jgi:hypothetical protein
MEAMDRGPLSTHHDTAHDRQARSLQRTSHCTVEKRCSLRARPQPGIDVDSDSKRGTYDLGCLLRTREVGGHRMDLMGLTLKNLGKAGAQLLSGP